MRTCLVSIRLARSSLGTRTALVEARRLLGQVGPLGDVGGERGRLGVEPRGGSEVAVLLVEVRRHGPVARQRGVDLGERGEPGPGPVGLTHGHRPVEPYDRAAGQRQQLVVPLHDLHPVGLRRRSGRRRGARRSRPAAGTRRAARGPAPPGGRPRPPRRGRCPTGCGPARRAARACRPRGGGRAAARGGAASGRAGRRSPGSVAASERASSRVSRIASAARSTSPE